MPDCVVRCYDCPRTDDGPRRWRYLCEDCAVEKQQEHKSGSGHSDVHLIVTSEPTIERVQAMIYRIGRSGW